MATNKLKVTVTEEWTDIAGAAASVANTTWFNIGTVNLLLSFQTTKPVTTDPYLILGSQKSYKDIAGSAHVWAKAEHDAGTVATAIAD